MNVCIYARVSTPSQNLESQLYELKRYCEFRKFDVVNIYVDKITGMTVSREGYEKMILDLKTNPLNISSVVFYDLTRVGRSLLDLINISKWFEEQKINMIFTTNNIDTTTNEGKLFFHIMGALSEYERKKILERTQLGREFAVLRGVKMGRPKKNVKKDEVVKLLALGVSKSEIARQYKVHRTTIYKILDAG